MGSVGSDGGTGILDYSGLEPLKGELDGSEKAAAREDLEPLSS